MLILSLAAQAAEPTGSACIATTVAVSPQASIEIMGLVADLSEDHPDASFLLGREALLPVGYEVVGVSDAIVTKSDIYVIVTACRPMATSELKTRIERLQKYRCERYKSESKQWIDMGWPASDLPPAPDGCQ